MHEVSGKYSYQSLAVVVTCIVILIAMLVLCGWQFNIEIFKRPVPGLMAMNPVTALCFIFSSVALQVWLKNNTGKSRYLLFALLIMVTVISLARLADVAGWTETGIDQWVYHNRLEADRFRENITNRMAPNTSVAFIITALALFLSRNRRKQIVTAVLYLPLLTGAIAIISIAGYVFQIAAFYQTWVYLPMAVQSATCFLLLSVAQLFALHNLGFMKDITSRHTGGFIARLLFPVALIVPLLFGLLILYGRKENWYSTNMTAAIFSVAGIIVLFYCIWKVANVVNRLIAMQSATATSLRLNNEKLEKEIGQSRKAEQKFRGLLEAAPDAMIIVEENGLIQLVNAQTEKMFGYERNEIIGQKIEMLMPERYQVGHHEHRHRYFSSPRVRGMGEGLELFGRKKDGSEFYIEISLSPMQTDDGMLVSAAIRDISDRKKLEAQLSELKVKEAEQRYRKTLDSMIEGCQIIDFDWHYIYVNSVAAGQGRSRPEELVGRTMMEAYPGIEHAPLFAELKRCMETRAVQQMENEFLYADGTSRWFELRIQPSEEGLFILSIDITERKKSESEILKLNRRITELNTGLEQKVAERTARLEAVNEELEAFTYSVSHDLRAPLRIIDGFADILVTDYGSKLDEEGQRTIDVIVNNARRMGQLIDDLLNLSRFSRQEIVKTRVNMEKLVQTVLDEQQMHNRHKMSVNCRSLLPGYCDRNLVKQVWSNLISNAIKYSGRRENPEISIGSFAENGETVYFVKDNGVGFNMQYAGKLFGVFQRLHKPTAFEGTGVGLALVKRIIAKHGGRVWAESVVNEGATFYFSLPERTVQAGQPVEEEDAGNINK